jgi:hypothetical protein
MSTTEITLTTLPRTADPAVIAEIDDWAGRTPRRAGRRRRGLVRPSGSRHVVRRMPVPAEAELATVVAPW